MSCCSFIWKYHTDHEKIEASVVGLQTAAGWSDDEEEVRFTLCISYHKVCRQVFTVRNLLCLTLDSHSVLLLWLNFPSQNSSNNNQFIRRRRSQKKLVRER